MSSSDSDQVRDNAAKRNRSIKNAVMTSMASKVGTLLLQFVSIPIAYRTLGEVAFGLYSTIAVGIGTLVLFQIGIGPALAHGLSRATSKKDELLEKQYFSTSWFLLVAFTLIGGLLASLVLNFVPLTWFLGEKYSGLEPVLLPGLWLGLGIILLEIILSHTERAREGFLQVHLNNLFGTAGNFLGAITVGVGIHFFQSIEFLLIAIFGTRALARAANTIHLFIQRPELLPKIALFRKPLAKEMLSDGVAFTVSQSLTGIIELNVCGLIVANIAGPVAVGHFQILMQVATLMTGLVVMFTTPTWPAIVDAWSRLDLKWIKGTIRKLYLLVLVLSVGAIAGLSLLGPFVFPLIYGEQFQPGWLLCLAFALYFSTSSWGHTNNSILVGLGLIKKAAAFSLLETLFLLIPAALGMAWLGLPGLYFGMVAAMLGVTSWLFPLFIRTALKSSENPNEPLELQTHPTS